MLRPLGRKTRPKPHQIRVGDRVRHSSDRSPRATTSGTATVIAVVDVLGRPEYRVRRDLPPVEGLSRETQWPGYVTVLVARGE